MTRNGAVARGNWKARRSRAAKSSARQRREEKEDIDEFERRRTGAEELTTRAQNSERDLNCDWRVELRLLA